MARPRHRRPTVDVNHSSTARPATSPDSPAISTDSQATSADSPLPLPDLLDTPSDPLPASFVPMSRPPVSGAQSRPAASLAPRPLSLGAFLSRVVIFGSAFLVWTILSTSNPGPGSPRPPALSPPSAPRGVGQPTHYTFSRLTVVADFIAIALAMGRIGSKVHRLPCVKRGAAGRVAAALSDLGNPAAHLAEWLRNKNFQGRPSESAEGHMAVEALQSVSEACAAAARVDRFQALWWDDMKPHAGFGVSDVLSAHFHEFEEGIWAFHPDEEDLGQYDDLNLVGNVNHHEAADLNRTAASFLSKLHATQLPELMHFCKRDGPPFQTPPEEFARLKLKFDSMVKQVEEVSGSDWTEAARAGLEQLNIWDGLRPGLLRRAVFWAKGLPWEYPCRPKPIFENNADGGSGGSGDEGSWKDPSAAYTRQTIWDAADPYFYASAWRAVLASQRVVRETVLPLVRETQAGLAEAQYLYERQVAEPSQRLKRQVAELVAGRGWELVERVQIGLTAEGHWLEVSRADIKAIPLTDLRNATVWRRMFLPLEARTADRLRSARHKLLGY
ncbi:uncharacterized protein B0H64DRAFT_367215 [Chaetomium fimeti]|uniref:Uncharacterized protein n=1 Tax=Chaetomium fimeti TaxID=1854472 RepID=A0AAE0H7L4_9PEZI|nr:hypothetical protein B0H64DRAFT_367215 [Chaetomium fimeti]